LLLQEHALQGIMSKKCDCYDNAMIESFWATLKKECGDQKIFSSRDEAKMAIFEFIEVYYNRQRIHISLVYISPIKYELQVKQKHAFTS